MRKILLPVDGSPRSMKSAQLVKTLYKPEDCEIYVITVRDDYEALVEMEFNIAKAEREAMPIVNKAAEMLDGYNVKKEVLIAKKPAEEIVRYAQAIGAHAIIMTKSTKTAFKKVLGSVTEHVVKNAPCIVTIVPEKDF